MIATITGIGYLPLDETNPNSTMFVLFGKLLLVLLILFPYYLYRFAAAIQESKRKVHILAVALTAPVVVATLALPRFPENGEQIPSVFVVWIEQLGFSADLAANGLEALEALGHAEYTAILMDCQMPEMDGYATTRHIIRQEEGPARHTPVIAMTAAAMEGDRDLCIQAGMDDYITKPIRPEEVEAALVRWAASRATG